MKKRKLLLFIGDSGSGKSTTADGIVEQGKGRFSTLISTATRDMRDGEVEGKDYYFVDVPTFMSREMIESVEFPPESNKFYGVQASEFERVNGDMILVVEPNGAKQIKEYVSKNNLNIEVLIIYMDIPKTFIRKTLLSQGISKEEVEARLSRGNIPGDFEKLGLKADLKVKVLNDNTVHSIIEWIEYNDEMYG